MSMTAKFGHVYLVGAGPGDPGLITVRGLECLQKADMIIYDRLVSLRLLDASRTDATLLCVNDLAERHPDRWPVINARMIEAARSGLIVVRLKGGDPSIFAHLAEETSALRGAGISYEIVPGVTAALGAAAFSEIPLTHRGCASAVAFVTGHENPEKAASDIDWPALARFPGTLVLYMSLARINGVVEKLQNGGKAHDTPVIVIQNSTLGNQIELRTTLANLPQAAQKLRSPCIIIVGPVVNLQLEPSWSSQRPLAGARIVVARPLEQGLELARKLEALGAIAILAPAIVVEPPLDWEPVDRAIRELKQYDWVVFTSANGIQAFISRMKAIKCDVRSFGNAQIAAIGPVTAETLTAYHLRADLVPEEYVSEKLASELLERVKGKRVLLVRADKGREILRESLSTVASVEQIAVYRQGENPELAKTLTVSWNQQPPNFILLSSSNIARAILQALTSDQIAGIRSGQTKLVTISGVTSSAVREFDVPIAGEAKPYTIEAMLEVVTGLHQRNHLRQESTGKANG
ncbi:uroporphyrinogen-III C-methyltransferase [soil metagenome]